MTSARLLRLLAVFFVFPLAALNVNGQAKSAQPYTPPKLWDSKTPDFRGIWQVRDTAYVNIEGHPAVRGIAPAKSIIVDPADGKIPYRPDTRPKMIQDYKALVEADPSTKCYEAGVPRATYLPHPLQIVQSPSDFAIVYQDNHAYRFIYPESRPHFLGIDWWMGDSRGHWDGNTFVVDVTTLNAEAWFDDAGNRHTEDMHVVERYTLTGPNTMQYEAHIEDPRMFTKPWTIRTTLYRNTAPGARLLEDECLEDENGAWHHISPNDPRNLQHNDYSRWNYAEKK